MTTDKETIKPDSVSGARPRPPFPHQPISPPGEEEAMHPRPQFAASNYIGSNKLKGKVALITGGDSGIGRSVAVLFAREGADIAFTFLESEKIDADATQDAITKEGRASLAIEADLTSPETCEEVIERVVEKFGCIDIIVNNAAFQNHEEDLENLTIEQWNHTFKVNIYPYFYLLKAAEKFLKKGSAVINTGSITGLEGSAHLLDYSATKGAIHAFTKSLAKNWVKKGIRVNCVAPGPVWTPLNPAERTDEEMKKFGDTPMGRPAQPEEIAPTYVFLASNIDSPYMTGEIITHLGGETRAG